MALLCLNYLLLSVQINPDPDLSADPEIDILKKEDGLANGGVDDYYDEEELGENNRLRCALVVKIDK